jgi:23S rRNA (guanosine2251-2'-O)-methyltransferase
MIVYGKNVAKELLDNKRKIEKAYVYEDFNDKNIISDLQKQNIRIEYRTKRELDNLAKGLHQGIILSIPDYKFYSLDELVSNAKNNALIIMLDHLEDPHNLGAIIRTCEAAGVDGIIIPKDRSVDVNSTVMKVSAGALDNIKLCSVTNLSEAIKKLKDKGFWIVGTQMNANDMYTDIDYNMPVCLIIGNEGAGMSRIVSEACDYIVSIPMYGKVNSLNASVATGIMIYGVLEKRRK